MYQLYKTRPPEAPELIYETDSLQAAEDWCDSRNDYLRLAGIPSSVCFWFVVDTEAAP